MDTVEPFILYMNFLCVKIIHNTVYITFIVFYTENSVYVEYLRLIAFTSLILTHVSKECMSVYL